MSLLFGPASLGGIPLRNRLVRSATLENTAAPDGLPTAATLRLYERLARGGVGLMVTGFAYVNLGGQSYPLQHGIHTDAAVPAWRRITDAVHARGARIAMQIAHGGRQTKPAALGGRQSLGPSAVPNLVYFSRSREMTEEEIWETIRDFGEAAVRVRAAGFDAVQLHAAHGYLISSFLSPFANRRRDAWGGDPQRRFRFLAEVYRAVRRAVGPGFPVLCKLNVDDFVWFGLGPREGFAAALRLQEMGLDALEISGGVMESVLSISRGDSPAAIVGRDRGWLDRLYLKVALGLQRPRTRFREAYFLPYARTLKPMLRIPLILVGGIRSLGTAERILQEGLADFIAMSRPLIREPGLPNRWMSGDGRQSQCESCNKCLGEIEQGTALRCHLKGGGAARP